MSTGTESRRAFLRRIATVGLALPARGSLGARSFFSSNAQYYSTVITQAWTSNPFAATIAARCRTVSSLSGQSPLSICSISSAARMQISVASGSAQSFYTNSGSSGVAGANDGAWHSLFATFSMSSGGTMTNQAWSDGVSDTASVASGVAMNTTTPTLYVGGRHNGTSLGLHWEGQISQVAYWNNVLTADEIRQCGGTGPNASGVDFGMIDRGLLDVADLSGEFAHSRWRRRALVLAPSSSSPTAYITSDARIIR